MPGSAPILQALRRYPGLDPKAVLAVAAQEGLGGGIGDNGTSYGPFQLHKGGAYPSSAPQNPGQAHQWAWSPAGIDYALSRINGVAGGQRGAQAVNSIVSRFERPADPQGEIRRALASYGSGGGAASVASSPTGAAAPSGGTDRRAFAQQLLAAISPTGQLDNPSSLVQALQTRQTASTPPASMSSPSGATGTVASGGASSLSFLSPFAQKFGLKVTSTTGGEHTPTSYHYKSRAEDYAGDPARMLALAQYALTHPQQFTEMFYDPAGAYVKNGRVVRGSIGGHGDHVHLAK
jgi:hypothetical protein